MRSVHKTMSDASDKIAVAALTPMLWDVVCLTVAAPLHNHCQMHFFLGIGAVLIIQVKALYVRGSGGVASFSKHEE